MPPKSCVASNGSCFLISEMCKKNLSKILTIKYSEGYSNLSIYDNFYETKKEAKIYKIIKIYNVFLYFFEN